MSLLGKAITTPGLSRTVSQMRLAVAKRAMERAEFDRAKARFR